MVEAALRHIESLQFWRESCFLAVDCNGEMGDGGREAFH